MKNCKQPASNKNIDWSYGTTYPVETDPDLIEIRYKIGPQSGYTNKILKVIVANRMKRNKMHNNGYYKTPLDN